MTVETKRGTIENVFQVIFNKDYEQAVLLTAVLSKENNEIIKYTIPADEIYEIKEKTS